MQQPLALTVNHKTSITQFLNIIYQKIKCSKFDIDLYCIWYIDICKVSILFNKKFTYKWLLVSLCGKFDLTEPIRPFPFEEWLSLIEMSLDCVNLNATYCVSLTHKHQHSYLHLYASESVASLPRCDTPVLFELAAKQQTHNTLNIYNLTFDCADIFVWFDLSISTK